MGNTPIDAAKPSSVAAVFLARKKEIDKHMKEKAQLITAVGSKNRKKLDKLVRDEHEHVKQEKMSILATQASSMESVQ
jgi:uncharacterized protein YajQ (UPF0234 family)